MDNGHVDLALLGALHGQAPTISTAAGELAICLESDFLYIELFAELDMFRCAVGTEAEP